MREFLCFNNEYHKIEDAINNNYIIKFTFKNEIIELLPKRIQTCPITSDIYIFGLTIIGQKLVIKFYRIFDVLNPYFVQRNFPKINNDLLDNEIDKFVMNLVYLETDSKVIGDE